VAAALALALAAAWAAPALACPVCYGEASGPVIGATQLSVAFLGGLVYLLLFGGIGMAVMVRRRAVRTMDPRHGLRLIEGSVEDGMENEDTGRDNTARPGPAAPEETSER
jgi:hypothetical protein